MRLRRKINTSVAASAILAVLLSPAAHAQTTGTIHGQVSDPTGSAIVNATVVAENLGTGLTQKATTNAEGSYLITALPPGTYKITISFPGFKGFVQSGIILQVSENVRVDGKLELGAISERVTVEADAVAVDTRSTTVGITVDNRRIESLPLNGRNVLALAQLLPGVGTATIQTLNPNARTGPTVTVSGSRVGGK